MKHVLLALMLSVAMMCSEAGYAAASEMENDFMQEFVNPPVEYYSSPLWVWNDDITEAEIDQQLDMLKSQRILQAFVHPRPGLITPYLSDRWLELYQHAVEGARSRGMRLHIYDENSYPSGFAGGHVPAQHPDWAGKGVEWERVDALPNPLPENLLSLYVLEGNEFKVIDQGTPPAKGPFALLTLDVRGPSPWNAGFPYVDLLQPGLTEAFLDITLEPYRKRFGGEFGKTVQSSFTDEPHLKPAGSLHWTPDLPDRFKEKYGYDLLDAFPSLFEDSGDFRKVRFDYFQLLLDLFIERWAKPYYERCAQYGLDFTGHYWEHEWPRPAGIPDNMAMSAWQQMPAIDCLMNQYNEGTHAQFGNVRMVRELASVANQLGRKRRLCEVYGAGGWEMTFEDQKRIADWLGVNGVNFFDQHLCYMTLRGARKRDHPLSFSDHEPWWEHYHLMGDYIARLSLALSQGEENNRILVLEPTTSGWLMHRSQAEDDELDAMGEDFQSCITGLSLHQIEYDLGCEQVIRDHGKVTGSKLTVGNREYDLVVLHHTCKNLSGPTFDLLKQLAKAGGNILFAGGRPEWVNGRENGELSVLFPQPKEGEAIPLVPVRGMQVTIQGAENVRDYLAEYSQIRFDLQKGGKLFHQYRQLNKGGLLFLCNTSKEEAASGSWQVQGTDVRSLDLFTGKVSPEPCASKDGKVQVNFSLPPAGSGLYLVLEGETPPAAPPIMAVPPAPATLALKSVERVDPNVLTVDFCDFKSGTAEGKDVYFFPAQTEIYKAHGFDRNPWDNAVQFKDAILQKDAEFGEGTGFTVTYHFQVAGFTEAPSLDVVIEQASLYTITLNGKPISPKGEWWLDRKFERLSGKGLVQIGQNDLVLATNRFSVHHEIEPVYVLGDFSLQSAAKGWVIRPTTQLAPGSWKDQGCPFYPGKVRYHYTLRASDKGRLNLSLGDWKGVVASASVNGEESRVIAFPPYSANLDGLKAGENEVVIEVIGSLKNLLGPHHGGPSIGTAWPGMFQKGAETGPPPGENYDTLPYGLYGQPDGVLLTR
jgi:hypothetical protein